MPNHDLNAPTRTRPFNDAVQTEEFLPSLSPHPILDNLMAFLSDVQANPNVQQLEHAAFAALLAYLTAALVPKP